VFPSSPGTCQEGKEVASHVRLFALGAFGQANFHALEDFLEVLGDVEVL